MKEATPLKRLGAYLVDLLLVSFVISLVININVISKYYDKYNKSYEEFNDLIVKYQDMELDDAFSEEVTSIYYKVAKNSVVNNIVVIVVVLLYFGVFQKFNHGQTIGKKLMKIKTINNNDKEVNLLNLLLKYSMFFLPGIGSVIISLLSSILVYVLNSYIYMLVIFNINFVVIIISIVSYIMILTRNDHKGLHDIILKIKVVNE